MAEGMQPKHGIVYRITNVVTGRSYIGLTRQPLHQRWSCHRSSAIMMKNQKRKSGCLALWQSIIKYGENSFEIDVLASAITSKSLNELEMLLIAQHDTKIPKGYNLTAGGEGSNGASEITRAKMAAAHTGLRHSAASRAKMSTSQKGRIVSDEARKKFAKAITGRKASVETRAKQSVAHKGMRHTPESIAKMKNRQISSETRAKLSVTSKGRKHNPNTILKMKGRQVSSETRAKLSVAGKGRKHTSETKIKISRAGKIRRARERDARATEE